MVEVPTLREGGDSRDSGVSAVTVSNESWKVAGDPAREVDRSQITEEMTCRQA